ncbi:hypothetical protein Poli38472_005640 [Pythium oligandrum]|uniref:Uncharacterized protein n=1 Tax=Pythium oligandrum TaxID=41045 RepID=A0A8K1CGN5_PYTOL|nr:hypothetical protein Poli38472_005640 [Pythium oligandrum]|eukprot:TMW63022.1 hypothetical protein Poli38472_005640 [Pythium oligandrum]
MTHALPPPSFFPTTKELSSGLQWFKDHPILAAAAATAVSVITYLNTAEDANGEVLVDDGERRGGDGDGEKEETVEMERRTKTALRKPGSDGRMSPATVSWVDEHGGSLTQVFEHLTTVDDHFPDLDGHVRPVESWPSLSPTDDVPSFQPRSITKRRSEDSLVECEHAHSTASVMHNASVGTLGTVRSSESLEKQAESPQWGWYVPITPPQDHLNAQAVPNAVVAPQRMERTLTRKASPVPMTSAPHSGSLRRSTSGRIK